MKLILVVPLLLLFLYSFSQNKSSADPYNLEMKLYGDMRNVWVRFFPTAWKIDTTEFINGKHPLKLFKSGHRWMTFTEKSSYYPLYQRNLPFDFNFYQDIFLPENRDCSQIEISANSKSHKISFAQLGIAGYDNLEQMIYVDSLDITNEEGWKTKSLSFPQKNLKYIKLGISGQGEPGDTMMQGAVWLDRINLIVNGKRIQEFPVNDDTCIDKHLKLNPQFLIHLSQEQQSLRDVKAYGDSHKRIIGFGESMHGSEDLCRTILQHIRYLITDQNCKVIMLENNPLVCLKWDRYVCGNTPDSTFDDICDELRMYKVSLEEMSNFLQWLREYNKHQLRKVRIRGIDHPTRVFCYVFDYLALIQKNRKDSSFYALMKAVSGNKYDEIIIRLEEEQAIKEKLGNEELRYLLNTIRYAQSNMKYYEDVENGADYEYCVREKRDFAMAERVRWCIANDLQKGEKAVIYAHSAHINKLPHKNARVVFIPYKSLGCYLKEIYGSQYFTISVQAGEGTFQEMVNPWGGQESGKLTSPPVNSFEYLALKEGYDYFFCLTSQIPKQVCYYRTIPNSSYNSQFQYAALAQRYDALIFIKESQALTNGVKIGMMEGRNFSRNRNNRIQEFLETLKNNLERVK